MEPEGLICVIDGDPAVRDSLATLIGLSGHEVATYATGREFLDAQDSRVIDCVVCEAQLPDTSGVELFLAFKRSHPHTRFALLLSRTDPAATALARTSGVDEVFAKPLVHGRLVRFVASRPRPGRIPDEETP